LTGFARRAFGVSVEYREWRILGYEDLRYSWALGRCEFIDGGTSLSHRVMTSSTFSHLLSKINPSCDSTAGGFAYSSVLIGMSQLSILWSAKTILGPKKSVKAMSCLQSLTERTWTGLESLTRVLRSVMMHREQKVMSPARFELATFGYLLL
jgi:hypothetical protein